MQRTISAMVGKGSVNHNSRKFKAENVDGNRTHLNIDYCNEPIKKVYHELFDEALKRYNDRQTRADRKIKSYYDKICNSKQEKPFHEIILQIGDKENMSAESENGTLAREILDEYYRGFQERNPQLKVFSAHLHMDEATPHLHIDFVPFITGSKRGLDTRVSLKQALAIQGFKGGSRGDTEWNQWVQSEKEQLAAVMERHGIEWEHKGTHEKHLSVLDYKKQEREKEINALEDMYRLVLHGESHFETRVYAMQGDLSFYRFISEEEKQRTCKEVLCFMYCLSPDHIESHIPDAIHEIQKWMADIRTNEEFDIIANPKKRIIHLYDIPLSAGLGENMLDSDIPYVEYETDVEDGDFALRVSGDSMEPDIPNGSTVFVKKQSEIADGISGAFFLNGEVYCKKLLHKDGKVFLCSDNAEYHPIEIHDGDTLKVYGKIVKVLC